MGYKLWADLEILEAPDLNIYLMTQVVARFVDAAARNAAIPTPYQGQMTYVIGVGLEVFGPTMAWRRVWPIPAGVATLSGGTAVVATPDVTSASLIQLTPMGLGTVTVPSALVAVSRTAGESFTILASQPEDTSAVAWQLMEPE